VQERKQVKSAFDALRSAPGDELTRSTIRRGAAGRAHDPAPGDAYTLLNCATRSANLPGSVQERDRGAKRIRRGIVYFGLGVHQRGCVSSPRDAHCLAEPEPAFLPLVNLLNVALDQLNRY
jgi:hypothetical protein